MKIEEADEIGRIYELSWKSAYFDMIYLWTLEKNSRARAFYETNGFTHNGDKITCDIGGKTLAEVRYIYC